MTMLRIPFLFLMLYVFMLSPGCSDERKAEKYTIGFSQCVGSDLWRRTMLEEMKMELSLHSRSKFLFADANNSSNRQIEQVKNMLTQGIDILIISPNEADPLTGIVEEAYKKGIPVVVIDRKTSSSQYTAYVGAENYQVGKIAGEYLTNTLNGSGKILEIMGLPGSSPAIERGRGLKDVIKTHPGIEVSAQLYGDWLPEHTERVLLENSAELDGISAIFAHNDMMAASAKKILNRLKPGNDIKVVGVDALPGKGGGLDMVSSKLINASILYPTGGKEAIDVAMRILNKEPFDKDNILQTVVIDSDNVQLMKLQWARISSQQHDIERQQNLIADQFKVYENQRLVLNFIVITLVLAVVFGGLAFHALLENRKINRSLEQKNEEILSQRNQLIEMSDKAEAATEAKLNFFTNISHEFRTPLTLILSPLEDLLNNEKISQIAGRELNLMNKNVYRLLLLVNQLMDYRKIEYKEFKIHTTANNLVEFTREIMESFQHHAGKRNIDLRLIIKKDPEVVWFDVNMLDKVIFNLLSNAFKFTADNGYILIYLDKVGNDAIIEVEDNGAGISREEIEYIFDRFYQSDTNYSRGSGLGLSLSKELMRLHRGAIEVRSKMGEGTTFKLSLPLGTGHLVTHEKASYQNQAVKLYDEIKIYTAALEKETVNVDADALHLFKSQSILIIEDNKEMLNYLTQKFEHYYEVFTASSGTEGLSMAYEQIPDLIISDIIMPGISGKELSNKLKLDLRTSHIPLILLTAQGSIEQQITGIQSKADVYITKPFNFEYLLANVENLISSRELLKEHYVSEVPNLVNKKSAISDIDRKFINDFSGIVEQNLGNEAFTVDEISKVIGISRVQLYRKVKALLNCTVTEYLLDRRLKKAKYYLSNAELSVSAISYKIGIASATYFSTIFKAKYGMTPTEFKKQQKGQTRM